MTDAAKKRYEEKEARIRAAIALKEGDRVPIQVGGNIFAIMEAGYTVADIMYDESLEKMKDTIFKYLLTYDPDTSMGPVDLAGEGRGLEILAPYYIEWSGRTGTKLDVNSIQQFNEFPVLLDEEFDKFFTDRTGWELNNSMPKLSALCKPLETMEIPLSHHGGLKDLIGAFSSPEMRGMIEKFWFLDDFFKEMGRRKAQLNAEIAELGFPSFGAGKAIVAFDEYSDTLRGTLLSLTDLYEYPDEVQRFIDEFHPMMLEKLKNMNKDGSKNGKFVHMTLHKGLDGFMSDEYYVKYYWRYLQEIIQTIVDNNMVPYVFCEGRYSTRVKHLSDIPKGKVIYKFEDTPLELVKKELGDTACITGGFPNTLLDFGTPQQVEDECKRIIDLCAPGGGFIFQPKSSLCFSRRENVETMFRTVKEYGKY